MEAIKKKETLADITKSLIEQYWQADALDGELPEDFEARLNVLEDALATKAQSILHVCESMTAQAAVHAARADQLKAQEKSLKAQVTRLKDWLMMNMMAAGINKLPTPDFPRLKIVLNNPAVNIYSESLLEGQPQYWVEQDPKLSKTKIAEDLKKGIDVEGAEFVRSKRLSW